LRLKGNMANFIDANGIQFRTVQDPRQELVATQQIEFRTVQEALTDQPHIVVKNLEGIQIITTTQQQQQPTIIKFTTQQQQQPTILKFRHDVPISNEQVLPNLDTIDTSHREIVTANGIIKYRAIESVDHQQVPTVILTTQPQLIKEEHLHANTNIQPQQNVATLYPDDTLQMEMVELKETPVKEARKAELPRKPCPECGKLLTNVKEHIKSVHWQVKNYICEHCEYSSSFKNDLVKHTLSRHSQKDIPVFSSVDKIQFQTQSPQSSQQVQSKVKGSPRAKNCEECGKLVVNMNEHIRYVHRKEKAFSCAHCDYKTLFKSDLIKHENAVHHGIRKVCKHCGKHVSNLSEHVRFVHQHAKNFKCDHCSYACVKPADLRKHIVAVHKFGKHVKAEQQDVQESIAVEMAL